VRRVLRIGQEIGPDEAHYEFPGFMVLSSRGSDIFRETYEAAKMRYTGKPFHGSPTFELAGLAELLQEIIDQGHTVTGLELESGWLEIHSMEDYKLACSMTL